MAFGSSGNRIPGQSKPSVDTMSDESTASEVTAEVVSDYLRDNPDFFNQHPEVRYAADWMSLWQSLSKMKRY